MSVIVQLALTFALLSILSIGGANATLPEIHRQVVAIHHWMDDSTFATLVGIGQTAPGPNILVVSMIGWHVAGLGGLLTASLAMVLPSSVIALGIGRFMERHEASGGVAVMRRALAPVAVGFMLASAIVMGRAAFEGWLSVVILVGVTASISLTRLSPVWSMAGGAVLGIAGHRLHIFG